MKVETRNATLRIVIQRTPDSDTWLLQGSLSGPAVDELMTTWKKAGSERNGRNCVIDVVDVTSIDEHGEEALRELIEDGVQFVGGGVYTRSLLDDLSKRYRQGA
ncbi:MAG TPA: hypothetical protein VMT67_00430 [Terriglobales bacterium]|nr:hypothetical protein [Terriglobales bacterium]